MRITSDRFGPIDLTPTDIISFPKGVIGFPDERSFVLVRHGESNMIGWLQSTNTPDLAFPVVSAHGLAPSYPDIELNDVAEQAGVEAGEDTALLAVLSASVGSPATVNLLAPIVVNSETRTGAQVILEGTRYTTRELFVLPNANETVGAPAEEVGAEEARP